MKEQLKKAKAIIEGYDGPPVQARLRLPYSLQQKNVWIVRKKK